MDCLHLVVVGLAPFLCPLPYPHPPSKSYTTKPRSQHVRMSKQGVFPSGEFLRFSVQVLCLEEVLGGRLFVVASCWGKLQRGRHAEA